MAWAASPRPAGLGVAPPTHRLFMDGSDRFWRTVLLAVCSTNVVLGRAALLDVEQMVLETNVGTVLRPIISYVAPQLTQ